MSDSRIRSKKRATTGYIIGRHGFALISAVEGIHLTDAMNEDLRDFDRRRLSPAARRKVIARKYGKAR